MSKAPYTPEQLAEFRDILDRKLADARSDLKLLQGCHRKAQAQDPLTTVQVVFGGAVVLELSQIELREVEARQAKYINHLEAALKRIDAGTYGICIETGKPIGADRLRLVPHAMLSHEGKMIRTNQQP